MRKSCAPAGPPSSRLRSVKTRWRSWARAPQSRCLFGTQTGTLLAESWSPVMLVHDRLAPVRRASDFAQQPVYCRMSALELKSQNDRSNLCSAPDSQRRLPPASSFSVRHASASWKCNFVIVSVATCCCTCCNAGLPQQVRVRLVRQTAALHTQATTAVYCNDESGDWNLSLHTYSSHLIAAATKDSSYVNGEVREGKNSSAAMASAVVHLKTRHC